MTRAFKLTKAMLRDLDARDQLDYEAGVAREEGKYDRKEQRRRPLAGPLRILLNVGGRLVFPRGGR